MTSSHYPYEAITSVGNSKRAEIVARAEAVLRDGWNCKGYLTLTLPGEIPWALLSQEERSLNFYIHALDMLDELLAAYDRTSDRRFIDPAITVGVEWVQRHPRQAVNVSPFAWYDMAVGMRAYRLAYLYDVALRNGLIGVAEAMAIWQSLEEHREELADESKIKFHNNHGYYQVAGQLALGRRFADRSPAMAELYAQGRSRLRRMLDQQFTSEGVHREHSPGYHRMVLLTLRGLIQAGLVEDEDIHARASIIEEALSWFVTPSGTLVNFGDTDTRITFVFAEDAQRRQGSLPTQSVTTREYGAVMPNGLRSFSASGYAVVRVPDPAEQERFARAAYLAQTVAFHSRTHKHADDMSIVWHDRGQPVLVDSGRYGYIGRTEAGSDLWRDGHWYSDPMRIFMESTRAHNTLEFDGRNFPRVGVEPYGSGLIGTHSVSGLYLIESGCTHFNSIRHRRILVFAPGQWLIVFDVFRDDLGIAHSARQWFHLAPGHVVTPVGGGMHVRLGGGHESLQVRSLLAEVGITEVFEGQREPILQGWWSPAERVAEPAPAFAFTVNDVASAAFASLFTFSSEVECDVAVSGADAHGSKARFVWRDDYGQHRVDLLRLEALMCEYAHTP